MGYCFYTLDLGERTKKNIGGVVFLEVQRPYKIQGAYSLCLALRDQKPFEATTTTFGNAGESKRESSFSRKRYAYGK